MARNQGQSLIQLVRPGSASLGKISPTAASTTDALGDRAYKLTRLQRGRQIFGDPGHQAHLVSFHRTEHNDPGPELIPELVGRVSQGPRIDPVDARGIFPDGALDATFDRWWDFFERRRDGDRSTSATSH